LEEVSKKDFEDFKDLKDFKVLEELVGMRTCGTIN